MSPHNSTITSTSLNPSISLNNSTILSTSRLSATASALVSLLIRHGVEVRAVTPDARMVEMVFNAGADINAADLQGGPPLHHAVTCSSNFLDGYVFVPRSYDPHLLHPTITQDGLRIGFVNPFRDTVAATSHFLGCHGLVPQD